MKKILIVHFRLETAWFRRLVKYAEGKEITPSAAMRQIIKRFLRGVK